MVNSGRNNGGRSEIDGKMSMIDRAYDAMIGDHQKTNANNNSTIERGKTDHTAKNFDRRGLVDQTKDAIGLSGPKAIPVKKIVGDNDKGVFEIAKEDAMGVGVNRNKETIKPIDDDKKFIEKVKDAMDKEEEIYIKEAIGMDAGREVEQPIEPSITNNDKGIFAKVMETIDTGNKKDKKTAIEQRKDSTKDTLVNKTAVAKQPGFDRTAEDAGITGGYVTGPVSDTFHNSKEFLEDTAKSVQEGVEADRQKEWEAASR